jgi:hypothetical protein
VTDIRKGGNLGDLKDEGSEQDERPTVAKESMEYSDTMRRHGIEVSFYRVLDRLEQVRYFLNPDEKANFFTSEWCS